MTTTKGISQKYSSKSAQPSDIDLRSVYDLDGSVVGVDTDMDDNELGDEDEDVEVVTMDISLLTGDSLPSPSSAAVPASASTTAFAQITAEHGDPTAPAPEEIGEYTESEDVDRGTNFAMELEQITNGYAEMIKVIDDLLAEVAEIDPEHALTLRKAHSRIPDTLRVQLTEDTDGSRDMMQEYLRTMKMGIVQAEEIDTYVPTTDGLQEDDEDMLDAPVEEAHASSTKPQGCNTSDTSLTGRNETTTVMYEADAVAAWLGAGTE